MKLEREHILKYLSDHKKEFYEKFGVTKIGLFGSCAREKKYSSSDSESDIDIIVELEKPDLLVIAGLKQNIEKDMGRKVDIIRERENMKPLLKKRVKRDAVYA